MNSRKRRRRSSTAFRTHRRTRRVPLKHILVRLPVALRRVCLTFCENLHAAGIMFSIDGGRAYLSSYGSLFESHIVQTDDLPPHLVCGTTTYGCGQKRVFEHLAPRHPSGIPTCWLKYLFGYCSDDPTRMVFLVTNLLSFFVDSVPDAMAKNEAFLRSVTSLFPLNGTLQMALLPRGFTRFVVPAAAADGQSTSSAPTTTNNRIKISRVGIYDPSGSLPGGSLDFRCVRSLETVTVAPLDFSVVLQTFSNLRKVDISVPPFEGDSGRLLVNLGALFRTNSTVEIVHVCCVTAPFGAGDCFSEECNSLRWLKTNSMEFTDDVLVRLCRTCKNCEHLGIESTEVTKVGLKFALKNLPRLKALAVKASALAEALDEWAAERSPPILSLKKLDSFLSSVSVGVGRIGGASMVFGSPMQGLLGALLEQVQKYVTPSYPPLIPLLAKHAPNIEDLRVTGNLSRNEVAGLPRMPNLRSFSTCEDLQGPLLFALSECPQLRSLRIRHFNCHFPSGLDFLILMGDSLRYVDIYLDDVEDCDLPKKERCRGQIIKLMKHLKYLRFETGGVASGMKSLGTQFAKSGMRELDLEDANSYYTFCRGVTMS